MLLARHLLRFLADLSLFTVRSGRWWISLIIVVLIVATAFSLTVKTAVPIVTYTLF